jgi:hypothetical protein
LSLRLLERAELHGVAAARKRQLPDAPELTTEEQMDFLEEVMREEIDRAVSR